LLERNPMDSEELMLASTDRIRALEEELRSARAVLEEERRIAEQATRLRHELLSRLSHDIRAPLHGIIGFAEIMYKGKVGAVAERHRDFLGDILTSARQLQQLVLELIDLARGDGSAAAVRQQALDVRALAGEVCDAVRSVAGPKGILLELDVDPTLGPIVGDGTKTKQMLYDFLTTALRLEPPSGRVAVHGRACDAETYELVVEATKSRFSAVLPRALTRGA